MSHRSILIEHDDFVVVNKPSSISMHRGSDAHLNKDIQTVLEWISHTITDAPLYLVHRLDTHTSGCLLLAKHKRAAAELSALFANRAVNKFYLALSDKKSTKKQGRISADMTKARNGSYKLLPSKNVPAVTFFHRQTLIAKSKLSTQSNNYLYYLKPITGKTHQLRVALKSLGSPILGDARYKGTLSDRLYLHSHMLSFTYLGESFMAKSLPTEGVLFDSAFINSIQDPNLLNWPKYKHPIQEQYRTDVNMIESKRK